MALPLCSLQEIEEKAPILQQQKKDYEQALHSVDQLSRRLDSALVVGAQSGCIEVFYKEKKEAQLRQWRERNCYTQAKKLLRDDENETLFPLF